MSASRSPGQRAGLTQERVASGARAVLERGGLVALTMRSVARELDVAPNALYSHVASKEALVDLVLDEVLSEVELPHLTRERDWQEDLRLVMTSAYDVLLRHRQLVGFYLSRQGARGPNAQRLGKTMMAFLAAGGLQKRNADDARRALIIHTIGSAAFSEASADAAGLSAKQLRSTFENGLAWLLDGIAATAAP